MNGVGNFIEQNWTSTTKHFAWLGLSLGFTLFYLSVIVLIPLATLVIKPWTIGLEGFWNILVSPRTLAALKLSFGASAIAAFINSVFGFIVAWVLVRIPRTWSSYCIDALVDLPFALPTASPRIALSSALCR